MRSFGLLLFSVCIINSYSYSEDIVKSANIIAKDYYNSPIDKYENGTNGNFSNESSDALIPIEQYKDKNFCKIEIFYQLMEHNSDIQLIKDDTRYQNILEMLVTPIINIPQKFNILDERSGLYYYSKISINTESILYNACFHQKLLNMEYVRYILFENERLIIDKKFLIRDDSFVLEKGGKMFTAH